MGRPRIKGIDIDVGSKMSTNVNIELGAGFWIFLTVLVLAFIAWRILGEEKLEDTFSHSITAKHSPIYSKN